MCHYLALKCKLTKAFSHPWILPFFNYSNLPWTLQYFLQFLLEMLQSNVFSKLSTYLLLSTDSLKSEQNCFSCTSNFQIKECRLRTKPCSVIHESLHECPWQSPAVCLRAVPEREARLCTVFSRKPLPLLNNFSCVEKFLP